jgi:CDP-glycerol glycerophosphotransferase (TagB/SpsB family)
MIARRLFQCLNYLFYFISFLFPRNNRKWVFGHYILNQFADNPKHLFLYVNKHHQDIRAIWITKDNRLLKELQQLGFEVYKAQSLQGVYHCLTAKAYFYSAYVADVNYFTSGGAMLINLWHGVGLKKIEFNITRGILADCYLRKKWTYRFCSPWRFKRPDYFLSSTPFQSIPFATAFRIPIERCLNIGYPRNDLMLMPEAVHLAKIARNEHPETLAYIGQLNRFSKVLIYMPTWRDSPNFFKELNLDYEQINSILKAKNEVLILKLHINTLSIQAIGLSNVWIFPSHLDVYNVFPYTHTLITDYSSVLYDYILLPDKEVILFVVDMENYIANWEFNYPFLPNVAGMVVDNKELLYQVLDSKSPVSSSNDIGALRYRFWGDYKGHAARDLSHFIKSQLGLTVNDQSCPAEVKQIGSNLGI